MSLGEEIEFYEWLREGCEATLQHFVNTAALALYGVCSVAYVVYGTGLLLQQLSSSSSRTAHSLAIWFVMRGYVMELYPQKTFSVQTAVSRGDLYTLRTMFASHAAQLSLEVGHGDVSHTGHLKHATRHTSHVTRHTSYATRHTPHVTRHTPHVTRHTPHVTRHTSHVTRHTSHVTRHTVPRTVPCARHLRRTWC